MADLRSCWTLIFVLFLPDRPWGLGIRPVPFLMGVCVIIGLSGGIPCLKLHFISFHFIIFIQVKGSYIYVFQPDLFKRLK